MKMRIVRYSSSADDVVITMSRSQAETLLLQLKATTGVTREQWEQSSNGSTLMNFTRELNNLFSWNVRKMFNL